ncbi:retrovirus-related Pol polyprotein from transposon 297 [Trichonephila clavipes]|nr:retrovirus-related Pol polyprotein from transposon 297 [Trichonephila clavipes]
MTIRCDTLMIINNKQYKTCDSCQRVGKPRDKAKAPLKLVPIISEVFSKINVDAVGPLPVSTKQNRYLITSICVASKYPESIPVESITSPNVIDALLSIFSRIGFPREIQSDMGTSFTSELTTTFFNKFGIKVTRSSVSHHQSNAVERVHRTIKRVIKALCVESGEDWELVMGKNLRTPQTLIYEEWMEEGNTSQSVVEYILQLSNRLKRCQDIAITRMKECQLKRKTWYDRDAVERKFVEGYLIYQEEGTARARSTIYHVNLLKPYHRRPELVSLVVEEVSDDIEGDAEIPYPDKQCTKFDYHEILRESQLQLKLSPSQIDELKQVITKNKDVFSPDPGTTHLMRMDIELISDKPIKTKPYRMSPRQINILREEIKRLLELGVIEIGQSDYTSPLILVETPNKDPRPCVDYRRLNEITRAEFFPLPNMEEIVEKVSAAPYVTVMDLSKGYFQIPLTQRYAAFVTPFGTYIPKKMMFGLGIELVRGVGLPSDLKIKAIADFPRPTTKTQVRSFLGLVGYYSHYIPNYSTIASPLADALKGKIKKEKITWDEKAFEELKAKLVSQPILFATDFILQTDASEDNTRLSFGARAAGVHYRLFSVWTLVPIRLGKQLPGNSTVDEIASEAADCRLTYTMANCPQRRLQKTERRKKKKETKGKGKSSEERRGRVVLGSGEENPGVLVRDANQESEMRIRKNALRTGPREAVERATSKRGYHTD